MTLINVSATSSIVVQDTKLSIILAQGAQGPRGSNGASGIPIVTYTADGALGGHRVVRASGTNLVAYADSTNVLHANSIIGITTGAVDAEEPASVQYSGELTDGTWSWVPDMPIFCGTNGLLTQTPPTTGFSLVLAVAVSSSTIFIAIKQSIILS